MVRIGALVVAIDRAGLRETERPRARCRGTLLLANMVSGWPMPRARPYFDGSGVSTSTLLHFTLGLTPV